MTPEVVMRRVVVLVLSLGLLLAPSAAPAEPSAPGSSWSPRAAQYPGSVTESNVAIPMSDGLELRGDVVRPVDENGEVVNEPLPVVVTITAYNKSALSAAGFGGGEADYLVSRGYVRLTVDARGTGNSPGVWQVFGEREQLDAKEVVEWAAQQPWSDGAVGMSGASYMGISQLFAAGQQPAGLEAIFPQVPSAEVYRDVVASGGQLDVGFMPLWLGLVNVTGLIPGTSLDAIAVVLQHLLGTTPSSLGLLLEAFLGGEQAYDGPYYEERSTLTRSVPAIDVPTFLVGGHYDLFQRGTPLVFQKLHERGVPVKMILGPWDHLQGSSGAEIVEAGYGTLDELQLRWFDHYVKDLPDPTLDADIADFTYYELGSGQWRERDAYLDEQTASVYHLSGTSAPISGGGQLTEGDVESGSSSIAPIALAGLCSRSATQWTAGVTNQIPLDNPCNTDNALNDRFGVVFETEPLAEPLHMLGPIAARLYASSTTGDGLLSVHVSRVQPDGRVERLTGGWQVMSLAALDEEKSVKLGDEIVQPWHPFTRDSRRLRAPGEVTPVDVEVFPTGAVINPGDRLRISVQTFDLPHLAPTLEQLPGALGVVTIHNSPEHPSRLVVPDLAGEVPTDEGDESGVVDAIEDALGGAAGLTPITADAGPERSWPARIADAFLPATGSPMSGVLILVAVALVLGGSALRLRGGDGSPSS
ncbi:CocE/NonD family hydrolase [Aeromicrobium phragmitis]|uniref:CocE/NonD family hydrolase n=2 Tax=Aeromicrobium phragmitis TaxID=2478914 RepID=A0A3L8PI76_9ACTN|nr:CocE/NonD family hydrolase [Aeromicrobium phragmitis]